MLYKANIMFSVESDNKYLIEATVFCYNNYDKITGYKEWEFSHSHINNVEVINRDYSDIDEELINILVEEYVSDNKRKIKFREVDYE